MGRGDRGRRPCVRHGARSWRSVSTPGPRPLHSGADREECPHAGGQLLNPTPPPSYNGAMTRADTLPNTRALIEQGLSEGLHIGAQLYVSRNGTPVTDLSIGE